MAPSPTSTLPATSSSSGRQTTPPSLKTSPRLASITGTPRVNAESVEEPATGTSSASARPRAVASAMRIDVKLPGPVPTTIASIERGSSTRSSIRYVSAAARSVQPSPLRSPMSAHTAPGEVAQSKDKIVCGLDRDTAMRLVDVLEGHRGAHRREPGARVLGPLDEGNRAIEVRLQVAPLLGAEKADAVEIEVRDRHGRRVAVADRVRRARDRLPDAERAAGAAHERRLARAKVAGDRDDVARPEPGGEAGAELLGLRRGCGLGHHPSRVFGLLEEAQLDGFRLRPRGDELDHGRRRGRDRTEQLRQAAEVRLQHLEHPRRVERGRGMEERIEEHARAAEHDLLLDAVHARDPERLAREELRGEVAERRDHLRLDQLDLAPEVRLTGLDLVRLRVAVSRRAAFEHVHHEHLVARHPDPGQQLAEQLPGSTDERHALLVLVEARRLADEHQIGGRRTRAEDHL